MKALAFLALLVASAAQAQTPQTFNLAFPAVSPDQTYTDSSGNTYTIHVPATVSFGTLTFTPGPPPPPPLAFDPTRVDSTLTLSNSNATVASTGGTDNSAFGTGFHSAGEYIVRFHVTSMTAGHTELGAATNLASFAAGSYIGSNTQSVAIGSNGRVLLNNASIGSTGLAFANGADVDLVFDLTHQLVWESVSGSPWNNSSTANPSTGVGGISIPGLASYTLSPAADLYASGDNITVKASPVTLSGVVAW